MWKKQEGFVPDVIVIDYADILAAERSTNDARSQVNDTWKALRRLSQTRHALVLTATQADAKSYGKASQTLKNFSEDKRKYAHITAMYTINQTIQEKQQNIYRIGSLLIREGYTNPNKEIGIVHCLDVGRPYVDSFETEANAYEDNDEDE